jgi:mannose-6-phosphate isomerase-like protein (cupin superfamily)
METTPRPAVHVPPDAGDAVWLVGDTYTLKLSGDQTGGAFSLSEALVSPGGGPPPHIHNAEDEAFVVLEGELLLEVDGRTIPAPVGTVLYVPKGTRHGFTNVGTTPARMLFLYTPAGMERMFQEIGTPARSGTIAPAPGPEDIAKLLSVASKYHFEILPSA